MSSVSPVRDQDKLERFVTDYSERGYQFAYGLCGNGEDAKELVQEAFCRILRHWDRYDDSQPLETWFLSILRNVYVDSVKRYERRFGLSLDAPVCADRDGGATLADMLADSNEEGVLERLSRESLAGEVRRAFAGLKLEHKAVLNLCDVEDLSYEEMAQVLDCPVGTVRSRVSRAREALKQAMLDTVKEVDAHGM